MSWSPSEENSVGVQYTVSYKEVLGFCCINHQTKEKNLQATSENNNTINGLKPRAFHKAYSITVTANANDFQSKPSEPHKVRDMKKTGV